MIQMIEESRANSPSSGFINFDMSQKLSNIQFRGSPMGRTSSSNLVRERKQKVLEVLGKLTPDKRESSVEMKFKEFNQNSYVYSDIRE